MVLNVLKERIPTSNIDGDPHLPEEAKKFLANVDLEPIGRFLKEQAEAEDGDIIFQAFHLTGNKDQSAVRKYLEVRINIYFSDKNKQVSYRFSPASEEAPPSRVEITISPLDTE
jgi:hypothetical protein